MDSSTGIGYILPILFLIAYFIPTAIAHSRGRDGVGMIFLLNLLLGWTVLGWVVLLIVAFTGTGKAERESLDEQTRLLRDVANQRRPE